MNGFKNTTRMQTFRTSADVGRTAGQTVGRVQSFARGGAVRRFATGGHAVPDVDPNHAAEDNEGHAQVQRQEPTTDEQSTGGGRSPLNSGYAKGGKAQHFHVHKHYHEGGKIRTVSKSYTKGARSAERAAEKQVEGAGPMMSKGGKPFGNLKKGALHKDLGVAKGKKIPLGKIKKAEHSANPTVRKRAQFADNARKFHHAEGGHIHNETHIPSSYPDYATGGTINPLSTGGTINPMNSGGAAYGGMAVGGMAGPAMARPMPGAPVAPSGALAARRAALAGRAVPGAVGARPLMRSRGGRIG